MPRQSQELVSKIKIPSTQFMRQFLGQYSALPAAGRRPPCVPRVRPTASNCASGLTRVGGAHEWHVVFCKAFHHITFGLVSRLDEELVFLVSPFSLTRFVPVGSISDAMNCDGVKELLIEVPAEC